MKSQLLLAIAFLSVMAFADNNMEQALKEINTCIRSVLLRSSQPSQGRKVVCGSGKVWDSQRESCISEIIPCNTDPSQPKCPLNYEDYGVEECIHLFAARTVTTHEGQLFFRQGGGIRRGQSQSQCPTGQYRNEYGSCVNKATSRYRDDYRY